MLLIIFIWLADAGYAEYQAVWCISRTCASLLGEIAHLNVFGVLIWASIRATISLKQKSTCLTAVDEYVISGRAAEPSGLTVGPMSKTDKVQAIVSHNVLSAKNRPGQILCYVWLNIDWTDTISHPPPAKPKNKMAWIVIFHYVFMLFGGIELTLHFRVVPVRIKMFRVRKVDFVPHHLPFGSSINTKPTRHERWLLYHMFVMMSEPFGITQSR